MEGQDLLAGLSLFTDLGSVGNHARLSWSGSTRESFATSAPAVGVLVPQDLRLNGSEAARFEESTIRVLDAVQLRTGNHGVKLGGDLAVATHDQAWRRGGVPEVLFGGVAELQQSIGVLSPDQGQRPGAELDWTDPGRLRAGHLAQRVRRGGERGIARRAPQRVRLAGASSMLSVRALT